MLKTWMFAAALALAPWVSVTTAAKCEPAAADPLTTFKNLNAYITSNPLDFETTFSSRSGVIDTDLLNGKSHFVMVQPNLMRLDSTSSKGSFLVISDGKTLTIFDKKNGRYAQTAAPPTVGASVNLFTGLMAVQPQILMFLDAVGAVARGESKAQASASRTTTIEGRSCNEYSLTGQAGAQWQAWLEAKDVPLPCRLISRDSDNPDAAIQTNEFKWAPKAEPPADTFTFMPPKGSKLVSFGDLGMTQ